MYTLSEFVCVTCVLGAAVGEAEVVTGEVGERVALPVESVQVCLYPGEKVVVITEKAGVDVVSHARLAGRRVERPAQPVRVGDLFDACSITVESNVRGVKRVRHTPPSERATEAE